MQGFNLGPEGLDPRGITVQQTKLEKHNRVREIDNTNKRIQCSTES